MKKALILGVVGLILGLLLGWALQPKQTLRLGGTTGLDSLSLAGSLTVAGDTTVDSGTLFVNSTSNDVAVNTTTNLGADLTVYSGTSSVSSTLMLGTGANGATNYGTMCFWNGANFTKVNFQGNTVTPTYVTSTSCP